jgi:hypothetical protein
LFNLGNNGAKHRSRVDAQEPWCYLLVSLGFDVKKNNYISWVSLVIVSMALCACGSSNSSPSPIQPVASPTAAPTAVPIPKASPFTSVTSVVGVSAVAASVTVPVVAGYAGSIDFGVPTVLPPGTTISTTVSNVAPTAGGVPALSSVSRQVLAQRKTASADGAVVVLTYDDLLFSNAVTYGKAPSFVLTVPAADVVTAAYYLAMYDPSRPSLAWQLGFEGPGTVTGTTIAFSSVSFSPFTFAANANYYFALYAISASAAAPTPAPSISPTAAVTATPNPNPTAKPTVVPTATPVPGGSSQPATPVPGGSSQPATPVPDGSSQPATPVP